MNRIEEEPGRDSGNTGNPRRKFLIGVAAAGFGLVTSQLPGAAKANVDEGTAFYTSPNNDKRKNIDPEDVGTGIPIVYISKHEEYPAVSDRLKELNRITQDLGWRGLISEVELIDPNDKRLKMEGKGFGSGFAGQYALAMCEYYDSTRRMKILLPNVSTPIDSFILWHEVGHGVRNYSNNEGDRRRNDTYNIVIGHVAHQLANGLSRINFDINPGYFTDTINGTIVKYVTEDLGKSYWMKFMTFLPAAKGLSIQSAGCPIETLERLIGNTRSAIHINYVNWLKELDYGSVNPKTFGQYLAILGNPNIQQRYLGTGIYSQQEEKDILTRVKGLYEAYEDEGFASLFSKYVMNKFYGWQSWSINLPGNVAQAAIATFVNK